MKQKMTFLRGFPAAGKSTFAENFIKNNPEYTLVSADLVRQRLYGSQDCYGDSEEIYKELVSSMRDILLDGGSILYDAVNMYRSYRTDFMRDVFDDLKSRHIGFTKILSSDVEKNIITIPTCKEVCIERHLARGRNIPLESITPYFSINEPPYPSEGWDNIWTACSMAYISSPFFKEEEYKNSMEVADILRSKGIETYVPAEHEYDIEIENHKIGANIFSDNIKAINRADTVFVLSYGRISTAGTNWEAGYSFGIGKRVVIIEMPNVEVMSLMVANGRHATLKSIEDLRSYDFIKMPQYFDNEMKQR